MKTANFTKRIISLILALILLLFIPAFSGTASAAVTKETLSNAVSVDFEVTYNQTEARSMLSMINSLRTSASSAWYYNESGKKQSVSNLKALTYDYTLEKIAMKRAAELAIRWDHLRPTGNYVFTLLSDNGYANVSAGENLAAGSASAERAFTLLCEENKNYSGQGHRRNMLSAKYTAVGIGHAVVNGVHFWVQIFTSINRFPVVTPASNGKSVVSVEATKGYFSNLLLAASTPTNILLSGSKCQIQILGATFADGSTLGKTAASSSSAGSNSGSASSGTTAQAAAGLPEKAKNLKARSSVYGVTVTWDPVPNADGYIIYGRTGSTGDFSYRYLVTGKTMWTDLNASSEQWNFYMVFPFSYNANGTRNVNTKSDYVYVKKVN